MHEMSIAIQLVETIRTVATDNGLRQVDEVALEVGPMTLIVPEALREAFALAAEGSPAAGAALEIKEL